MDFREANVDIKQMIYRWQFGILGSKKNIVLNLVSVGITGIWGWVGGWESRRGPAGVMGNTHFTSNWRYTYRFSSWRLYHRSCRRSAAAGTQNQNLRINFQRRILYFAISEAGNRSVSWILFSLNSNDIIDNWMKKDAFSWSFARAVVSSFLSCCCFF